MLFGVLDALAERSDAPDRGRVARPRRAAARARVDAALAPGAGGVPGRTGRSGGRRPVAAALREARGGDGPRSGGRRGAGHAREHAPGLLAAPRDSRARVVAASVARPRRRRGRVGRRLPGARRRPARPGEPRSHGDPPGRAGVARPGLPRAARDAASISCGASPEWCSTACSTDSAGPSRGTTTRELPLVLPGFDASEAAAERRSGLDLSRRGASTGSRAGGVSGAPSPWGSARSSDCASYGPTCRRPLMKSVGTDVMPIASASSMSSRTRPVTSGEIRSRSNRSTSSPSSRARRMMSDGRWFSWSANSPRSNSKNLPCSDAASEASAPARAFGWYCVSGACRQT